MYVVFERFVTKIRRTSLASLTHTARKALDYNEKTRTPTQVHMVVDQVSQTDLGVVLVRGVVVLFQENFILITHEHRYSVFTTTRTLKNLKKTESSSRA